MATGEEPSTGMPTMGLRKRSTQSETKEEKTTCTPNETKYTTITKEASNQPTKYILVGYKGEFDDPTNSFLPMTRLLDIEGREIYGVSFTTVMPTEVFHILDGKLGYKRRFYPQGKACMKFTRALEGDEKRGHNKPWILADVKPGTEVSIYFAPSEGSLAWSVGPPDTNFDMPPPKEELSSDDISAVTQFEVDNGILSNILLAASDPLSANVLAVFHVVPHLIMLLLLIWVMVSAPKQMTIARYHADTWLEWINIGIIYFAIIITRGFNVGDDMDLIREAFALANKLHDNEALAQGIRFGAALEIINLLQGPVAFVLSVYVAVYLSDDVFLNVLLNVVALEFVGEIDDAMVSAFTEWRFSQDGAISVALLDITYGVDEGIELWHESDFSAKKVHEDLSKGTVSNSTRWKLLTSRTKGLGLLDVMEDGREVVLSFKLHLSIIDWDTMPEQTLVKEGGLYLAATTNETWEHHISKTQRTLLLKHFPELAIKFPWYGTVKLETHGFGIRHAPFIVQIANTYSDVDSVSCWFESHGDASVAVLRDGLIKNQTLKHLVLNNCGLSDSGAMDVAKLLRGNSTLAWCWLVGNKGIGNAGALSLAAALTEGDDANKTLHRIMMGVNNVSTECQEKCVGATNGRMIFLPDDHPVCAFFLKQQKPSDSSDFVRDSMSCVAGPLVEGLLAILWLALLFVPVDFVQ